MLRWRMCLGTVVLFLLLAAGFLFTLGAFHRLEAILDRALVEEAASHGLHPVWDQSLQQVRGQLEQVTSVVLICLVTSGLVALLTFRRFGRAVLDPLDAMAARVEAMERQGFHLDLPAGPEGEMARLVRSINALGARIRSLLRESGQRFAALARGHYALLRALPTPVFLLGPGDRLAEMNPAAEALLHSIGAGDVLPPVLIRLLAQARRTGQHVLPDRLQDAVYLRAGAEELYYLPRILHLRHPDGAAVAESTMAVVLVDVTRYRWLEGMKTSQLATVSHEIKTPLTSIRMMLHLLLEKKYGPLAPAQEEMLQTALGDCERLLRTLHHLLDISRFEAGSEQMILRPAAPEALLLDCEATVREEAARRGLVVERTVAASLPPVEADDTRFPHALANLAGNAVKFARSRVRLAAEPGADGGVRFVVEDDGPGVPEDYRSRIFERFFRVPGQPHDGAGLGLSIAREIVRAHGGRMGVADAAGGGARFHIELPARPASGSGSGQLPGGEFADFAPDLGQSVGPVG
jgi:signal transduction histidine kinase